MEGTPTFLEREAALAALYPDEPSGIHTVINIGPDPWMLLQEHELQAKRAEKERRAKMIAEFDRAHPTTEGDRARMAAAEAKRARRLARNRR